MNHPLVSRLQGLVAELSGKQPDELDPQLTFYELGLDSLFLTQLSRELGKAFGVKVAFRQLAERWPSIESLARHLADRVPSAQELVEQTLPSNTATDLRVTGKHAASTPFEVVIRQDAQGGARLSEGPLHQLFEQQLEVMSHQLEMLAGSTGSHAQLLEGKQCLVGRAPMTVEVIDSKSSLGQGDAVPPTKLGTLDVPAETTPTATGVAVNEREAAEIAGETTPKRPTMKPGQWGARIEPRPGRCRDGRPRAVRSWSDLSPPQQQALRSLIDKYSAKTARSKALVQAHRRAFADPRSIIGFNPVWKEITYPLVVERASGSRIWDVDGNQYIDLLNGFGQSLLGHSHPVVLQALRQQLERNLDVGPLSPLAGETAELLCELTGMDRACFMCTGSEAVQAAIRCARTYTGRDKIVVFENSYHGSFDEALARSISMGKTTCSWPSVPGVPPRAVEDVVVLPYAKQHSLDALRAVGKQVAAVLVEPVQSRHLELQPREFLQELRAVTQEVGALLVFDEVVTGFRCHLGGAQAHFDVRADLAIYGKACGGGMPLGVVAGRAAVMDTFDGGAFSYGDDSRPSANVSFFAGTFVRHPLALSACRAVLEYLKERGPTLQRDLAERTQRLAFRINALFDDLQVPLELPHFSSVMYLRDKDESDLSELLWPHLLYHGVHVQRGFPSYLTLAHEERDLELVVDAFRKSLEAMASCGFYRGTTRRQSGVRVRRVPNAPPVTGARLGRDVDGRPAWFIAHPSQPNRYIQLS